MDPTRIALFELAEKRLNWAAQRQTVLASNIANINTPGYQGRDITPFDKVLSGAVAVAPAQTQPGHRAGTVPSGALPLTQDHPRTRSLDRNDVTLDEQLVKVADTETTQNLVTNIWKTYMGMFSMALGKGV
jgi:flagellar basal-body rod protein FlgB